MSGHMLGFSLESNLGYKVLFNLFLAFSSLANLFLALLSCRLKIKVSAVRKNRKMIN